MTIQQEPQTPLVYLKKELNFKLGEYMALDDPTKEWYRQAAVAEMKLLGLPIK